VLVVPVKVVIAEDNLLVREGMRNLLERRDELEIVATCSDYESVLMVVARARPDVVVTDIRMPPGQSDEGIQVANQLRESHPRVGVVLVSQHADPSYALALLEHGSERRAYLLKERIHRVEELAAAIVAVARGDSVIDPLVVEGLVWRATGRQGPLAELTKRELQILDLMAQGKTNGGIAATLHLAEHSVEKYVSSILGKLDLGDGREVHRRVKAVLVYLSRPQQERLSALE
jgi:DNA-binding NarL/FixJ family response regulator